MTDVDVSATTSPDASVDRPFTRVGAYALCVRDGRILLARMGANSLDAGMWTLPDRAAGAALAWTLARAVRPSRLYFASRP